MSRKRYSPEKIIGMLREAEVALAQGMTVGLVCRELSISDDCCQLWVAELNQSILYLLYGRIIKCETISLFLKQLTTDY